MLCTLYHALLTIILWFRIYYFYFIGKKYNDVEIIWNLESEIYMFELWTSFLIVLRKTFQLFESQFPHWSNREIYYFLLLMSKHWVCCFTVNFHMKGITIEKFSILYTAYYATDLIICWDFSICQLKQSWYQLGEEDPIFSNILQAGKVKLRYGETYPQFSKG